MADEEGDGSSRQHRTSLLHKHSSPHSPVDPYDHAIDLIDSTIENNTSQTSVHRTQTEETLGRRRDRVRASVKGEYNRQRYKKYQKERSGREGDHTDEEVEGEAAGRPSKDTYGVSTLRRNYDRVRDRIPMRQKTKEKARSKEEYEVDVLYENQRGSFFCGIPLYSDRSLLNFDPPAWQTREFKESPVNITNAQPPDPTWTWAWKTWYVDMSHDVDEEGWEYSFSFSRGFVWHGTHPWFHSFVRRRRWLRKRVKVKRKEKDPKDALQEAHKLNLDYFTIHSAAREPSADHVPTVAEVAGNNSASNLRYSVITSRSYASDDESENAEDIGDVNALVRALKRATVDRKKLGAVKSFLANAGPELHYLPDRMPEIMDLFIYQTSRQQVVHELQQAAGTDKYLDQGAATGSDDSDGEDRDRERDGGGVRDQLASLEKAIRIAHDRIQHFEYWSDIKETVAVGAALDVPPPPLPRDGPDLAPGTGDARPSTTPRQRSSLDGTSKEDDDDGRVRIKGIPREAHVGEKLGIARRVTLEMRQAGEQQQQQGGPLENVSPENVPLPGDARGTALEQVEEKSSTEEIEEEEDEEAEEAEEKAGRPDSPSQNPVESRDKGKGREKM